MKRLFCIGALCGALSACSPSAQQISIGAGALVAANTAGAIVAGVINPAIAIPSGTIAGALNGAVCSAAKSAGGSC